MKTALNWAHKINSENMTPAEVIEEASWNAVTERQIKQIQLDAMKEGMRRAAKVSREHLQGTASGWVNITQRGKTVSNAILSAAEQLTEKDL